MYLSIPIGIDPVETNKALGVYSMDLRRKIVLTPSHRRLLRHSLTTEITGDLLLYPVLR
jgi:hypothetical protein